MTWWTDILFLGKRFEEKNDFGKEESIFALFLRAAKKIFYDNFVDTLHAFLTITTYAYLAASVAVFFFQKILSLPLIALISAFSEPYLGALGLYLVVNEIRRRRGKNTHPHLGTIFVGAWLILLAVSTLFVYFDTTYHFNRLYQTIVTNSFATVIIRLGTIISRIAP